MNHSPPDNHIFCQQRENKPRQYVPWDKSWLDAKRSTFEGVEVPNVNRSTARSYYNLFIRLRKGESGESRNVRIVDLWIENSNGFGSDYVIENEIVVLISDGKVVLEALCKFTAEDFPSHRLVVIYVDKLIRSRWFRLRMLGYYMWYNKIWRSGWVSFNSWGFMIIMGEGKGV